VCAIYTWVVSALGVRAAGGLVAALAIAIAARRARALSVDGAIGAVVVGTVSVAAGWDWGALLIAFFLTSTFLSRSGGPVSGIVEKGGERDAIQVLANGGLFAAAAAAFVLRPTAVWQAVGAGALAASTSDTWATEIGTRAKALPRSIVTWRPVSPGTSGGVTVHGTLAAFGGAAFLGALVALVGWPAWVAATTVIAGIVGSTADSVLGATLQARRRCPQCNLGTERLVHSCGARTAHAGGVQWLTNDGVNAVSSAIGAAVGLWGGAWTPR
jgi:uncharacterized protein (TIGR00297 family)